MEARNTVEPIPLIQINHEKHQGKHKYTLNEQGVERYLLSRKVRDLRIAVISVTGKMRKGKSYILNLILNYAMETCDRAPEEESYRRAAEEDVKGFQIGDPGGREAHGIFIWPEIFVRKTRTGENIGILLVDTQGTMSSHTPMSEWADIFTISTLFCSIQIYNVSVTIGEQQLQNLELFSEYARHVAQSTSTGEKPFDHLLILVRDFKYGEEYGYGISGGEQFFEAIMLRRKRTLFYFHTNALPEENREVREHILHSFRNTTCCCLPHPGFEGKKTTLAQSVLMKGMDARFQKEVIKFVNYLMSPENLTSKKVNNEFVTLTQLYEHLRKWVSNLNKGHLPMPVTLYKSTAQRQHQFAIEKAMERYEMKMEAVGCASKRYLGRTLIAKTHDLAKEEAVDLFHDLAKFGRNDTTMDRYKLKLERIITERYHELVAQNNAKNAVMQLQGKAFFAALFLVCLTMQWLIRQYRPNRLKPYEIWVTMAVEGLTFALIVSIANVALLSIWNWWRNSALRSALVNK